MLISAEAMEYGVIGVETELGFKYHEIITRSSQDILRSNYEDVENVSDAATMMHLMNANNLTAAAFKYEGDTETLADVYTEAVDDKNWLCGAPEKFVIMKAGGYIISAFGQNDIVDTFTGYTEKLIDNAEVLTEHPVTE